MASRGAQSGQTAIGVAGPVLPLSRNSAGSGLEPEPPKARISPSRWNPTCWET